MCMHSPRYYGYKVNEMDKVPDSMVLKFYVESEKKIIFHIKHWDNPTSFIFVKKVKRGWFYTEWLQLRDNLSQWVRESAICVKSIELRFSWEVVWRVITEKVSWCYFHKNVTLTFVGVWLGRARVKNRKASYQAIAAVQREANVRRNQMLVWALKAIWFMPLGYGQDGIQMTTCRHTWMQMGEWGRLWGLWRTQIKQDKNKPKEEEEEENCIVIGAWFGTLSEHWNHRSYFKKCCLTPTTTIRPLHTQPKILTYLVRTVSF